MKKAISLLMSVLLILTVMIPAVSVSAVDGCACGNTPVIYIKGRTMIYKDTENPDAGLAEKNFPKDKKEIARMTYTIATAFAKAMATDKWEDYSNVLYEEIIPMYDQYALNNDGEIDNKSGIRPEWSIDNILKRAYEGGKQRHIAEKDNIFMYEFQYDMRLDPLYTAKNLRKLVEAVKEITGHKKVNILGRCEGGVIENAYFSLYGWDDVESAVIYNSIACGTEVADACFSGEIFVDSASLNRFVYEFLGLSPVLDLILTAVDASEYAGMLENVTDFVQMVQDKVGPLLFPRLIRDIYGKCPGWYSLISPDYFEKSKSFVLCDNADGKYDKLIEKIDNYNYNYKVNARKVLENMAADGVHVYVITKYNYQMYPVIENRSLLGDSTVSLYKQTYEGATCSDITKTLDKDYLATADRKFISPDKMIDVSTGVLPEHTWFVRNMSHEMYPDSFNPYLLRLMRSEVYADGSTFEDMPQWLLYTKSTDTFTGINEENAPAANENRPSGNPVQMLKDFIARFINFIKYIIEKISAKVNPK